MTFFDYITINLAKNSTILEFGSGETTQKLVENYKVYSVENYEPLINQYHDNYIYAPLKPYHDANYFTLDTQWYDIEILEKIIPTLNYDLVLIDGPVGYLGRSGIYGYFDRLKIKDVPIIVDDTQRIWEHRLACMLAVKLGKSVTVKPSNSKVWFSVIG